MHEGNGITVVRFVLLGLFAVAWIATWLYYLDFSASLAPLVRAAARG